MGSSSKWNAVRLYPNDHVSVIEANPSFGVDQSGKQLDREEVML
jgi:hypothetical protein